MRHVVQFSSGLSSYEAAKRVAAKHGTDNLTLLFTDTLFEHPDNYRFLIEAAADVYGVRNAWSIALEANDLPGIREDEIARRKLALVRLSKRAMEFVPGLVWLIEGRTPLEVYRDEKFLGNSRVALCSRILKREVSSRWRDENCDPQNTVLYIGFNYDEQDRMEKARKALSPWRVEFPMDDSPYLLRVHLMQNARERGIQPPRLYFFGFKHANCFGACCQAGQAEWARTHDVLPEVFGVWERGERGLREYLDTDVSMLTDRRCGEKKTLTLTQLRERIAEDTIDFNDTGSCSCFSAGMEVA